ncbi:MAG TPA: VCBS repeat-containing protein [Candidatus Polarisedimenticolaceae bacterium]
MIAAILLAAAPAWTEVPGASILEAQVEGTIVAWLPTEAADGRREIVLVVRQDPGGEQRLLRLSLDPARPGVSPLAAPPLPREATVLAPRLGAGTATTLVASREGAIDRLDPTETPRWVPWITDPALRTNRGIRFDRALDGAPLVLAAGPGSLVAWRVDASGTTRLPEAAIPVEVRRASNGLNVVSLPLVAIAGRLVTPPVAVGLERVRIYAADATAWPPAFETCWGRLPSPERVLDSAIVTLDGEPHAVVTTMDATKLEVFGEKRLRVFPLRSDRTRAGVEARLASETDMNLWQPATFVTRDLNGDGRDDLAIAYWKGLRSVKAAVEVRLADGAGGFGPARRTEVGLDEDSPGWLGFDRDLDGDAVPDLALVAGARLKAFRGRATADGRRVVEPRPYLDVPAGDPGGGGGFSISIGASGVDGGPVGGGTGVRVEDIDGDAAPEVIVASGSTIRIIAPKRAP